MVATLTAGDGYAAHIAQAAAREDFVRSTGEHAAGELARSAAVLALLGAALWVRRLGGAVPVIATAIAISEIFVFARTARPVPRGATARSRRSPTRRPGFRC